MNEFSNSGIERDNKLSKWIILESEMALDERWCRIRRDRVRLPDGSILDDYFLAVRRDVVVIFALSDRRTLPLVRQYKHGVGEFTLELPAGTIADESPEAGGRRELLEETGWEAEEVTCIGAFFDDASKNTNKVHCLVAHNARQVKRQNLDQTEASAGVQVVEVGVDELEKLVAAGEIRAQSSVASIYCALAWLRDRGAIRQ